MWIAPHHRRGVPEKVCIAVHILAGAFCGVLYPWYPGMAIALFAGFGGFEYWEAKVRKDKGYKDFWEGLIGWFFGAGIALVLRLAGII